MPHSKWNKQIIKLCVSCDTPVLILKQQRICSIDPSSTAATYVPPALALRILYIYISLDFQNKRRYFPGQNYPTGLCNGDVVSVL